MEVPAAMGFVVRGNVPVILSSAATLMKGWEQIRNNICFSNLNVKIIGGHAGLSAAEEGVGFQSLEDLALMRVLPNMKVIAPADYGEAVSAFEEMLLDYGPVYVRLPKGELPVISRPDYEFKFGKAEVVLEGKDVVLFACGSMVDVGLQVARKLKEKGLKVAVVSMPSVKPLDEDLVVEMAEGARFCVTLEDHSVIGGLGDAVGAVMVSEGVGPLLKLGIDDRFCESGAVGDLYKKYGLDVDGVVEKVLDFSALME